MNEQNNVMNRAKAVKERHQVALMQRPGVVGVGVGLRQRAGVFTDEVCIVVMVQSKHMPEALSPDELLPADLEGIPVDVQQVGDITIQ